MENKNLISEALAAFGTDSGYLTAILKAAHTVKARQKDRLDRTDKAVVDSQHDNTN